MPSATEVLVVDDDPDFRTLARAYLPPGEFSVTEADNGRAALERLRQRDFDLAVLDLVMPELDGLELISAIRDRSPRCRILAVSGVSRRSLYLKIAEIMGADLTLEKPTSRERFYGCVRQVLTSATPLRKPEYDAQSTLLKNP